MSFWCSASSFVDAPSRSGLDPSDPPRVLQPLLPHLVSAGTRSLHAAPSTAAATLAIRGQTLSLLLVPALSTTIFRFIHWILSFISINSLILPFSLAVLFGSLFFFLLLRHAVRYRPSSSPTASLSRPRRPRLPPYPERCTVQKIAITTAHRIPRDPTVHGPRKPPDCNPTSAKPRGPRPSLLLLSLAFLHLSSLPPTLHPPSALHTVSRHRCPPPPLETQPATVGPPLPTVFSGSLHCLA